MPMRALRRASLQLAAGARPLARERAEGIGVDAAHPLDDAPQRCL